MPRLLFFAPCEKVITDRETNTLSLIGIVEGIASQIPRDEVVPPDAVAPMTWAVVALWYRLPEDENQTYEVRLSSVPPNGQEIEGNIVSFIITERTHRIVMNILNFPIGQPGEQVLKLAIRNVTEDSGWIAVSEYPILVGHMPIDVPEQQEE